VAREAFVVNLGSSSEFQSLLPGSPKTCGMKSGRVYLEAGKSCGQHSTNEREELLVFLAGQGQARCTLVTFQGSHPGILSRGQALPGRTLRRTHETVRNRLSYLKFPNPAPITV